MFFYLEMKPPLLFIELLYKIPVFKTNEKTADPFLTLVEVGAGDLRSLA